MSPVNCFNLDQSKILLSGNGLTTAFLEVLFFRVNNNMGCMVNSTGHLPKCL